MENNHYRLKLTQKYWLGRSSILTLLIITTVIYLTQGIIRKNCKTCNNKNLNIKENQEEIELQPLSVENQTNTEEIHPLPRVLTIHNGSYNKVKIKATEKKKNKDHRKYEEFSHSKLVNHSHLRKKLITPTESNHNEL